MANGVASLTVLQLCLKKTSDFQTLVLRSLFHISTDIVVIKLLIWDDSFSPFI